MSNFKINSQIRWYLLDVANRLSDGRKVKGWKNFKSKYREMEAFYHDGLKVVVKRPKFIMDHRTPCFVRIPTIKLGDGWVVQPLACKMNLKLAVSEIKLQLKPHLSRGIFPDIHNGNVGWYQGKPLMFDW